MQLPSLLFLEAPTAPLPENLPEDLKLTLLLPEDVLPALRMPCGAKDIAARQTLLRALEKSDALRERLTRLADDMRAVADCHRSYSQVRCENERYLAYLGLVNAAQTFCRDAAEPLPDISAGTLYDRFAAFFVNRVASPDFGEMEQAIGALYPYIDSIRSNRVRIRGNKLRVSAETPVTFEERLVRCAAELGFDSFSKPREVSRPLAPQLIDAIASLYPEQFAAFKGFFDTHRAYFDEKLLNYRLELSFLLALTALSDRVRKAGIPLTYPEISAVPHIDIRECYDITLLAKGEPRIVPNDVLFDRDAPLFYLTGANGGGKTTYLRTVGVAVLLFLVGAAVPCRKAVLYPLSGVYTHFPRDERFDGDGRFADEKKRIAEILDVCGNDSLILLNETFATTSEETAVTQTEALAEQLYGSGCFGLYITHQHSLGQSKIPFLNVIVDSDDENRRTYKIARRRGGSSSYAQDILKKYSLTREALEQRFPVMEGGDAK